MKRLILSSVFLILALAGISNGEEIMKARCYIAPQVGDGTEANPYRSLINNFIDITQGEWFDEIDNPARRISLVCVHALQGTHNAIAADSSVITVGSTVDDSNLQTALNSPISAVQNLATLKTRLEEIGISTAWYSTDNTVRDGLRYLIRVFIMAQLADGTGNANVKAFIANNLDTTINQVPVGVRNAASTWMQEKGLATGWITSTTTVRQILHFIVTNLGFGVFRMSGGDF